MDTGKFFQEVSLPEQKAYDDGIVFPAVLSPTTNTHSFTEAIKAQKPWLESLLNERGVILFRGFPVTSPSEFNDVVEAFGFPELPYVGGRARRTKVVGRVYTANEAPPENAIPFHHEMASLAPNFPSKLFFFCEEAPGSGGQTPLVLSHIVYEKMKEKHPEFVAQLEKYGMRYKKIMNDEDHPSSYNGSGWKSAYNTDDKNILKEMVAELGSTKLEWIGNSVKLITDPLPAIRIFDKESQRKVWFNNISTEAFVELGNGDLVPEQAKKDCLEILEEECVVIPWKKGDVMLINNLMVLHGRRPVLKLPRRVLASLCK